MTEEKILLTKIQRFSIHDGPGIRTTIFLKGCALKCPWCSNPENIHGFPENYRKDGEQGIYGYYLGCDEIYFELMRDVVFYKDGGITYSGGEPLLQVVKLEPLMKRLKANGIHQCMETSLFAPLESIQIASEYVDLFYIDVKLLNKTMCKSIIKGELDEYFRNIKYLLEKDVKVIFRIPVIAAYTDSDLNRKLVQTFLGEIMPDYVEMIEGHNLGRNKYSTLGLKPPEHLKPDADIFRRYKEEIEEIGIKVITCTI